MLKVEFDEMQQQQRYKSGYQSFILLAILLMADNLLNGLDIIWAKYSVNTFIILLTAFTYFICRCIWFNAMIGLRENARRFTRRTSIIATLSATIAILAACYVVLNMSVEPTEDQGGLLLFSYCLMMCIIIAIVYIIKYIRSR